MNKINYDDNITFCTRVLALICISLDIFVSPVIFFTIWNSNIPSLFNLPQITYAQALLFKLILELYFGCSFSSYFVVDENIKRNEFYVNKVYGILEKIEYIFGKQKNSNATNTFPTLFPTTLPTQYNVNAFEMV